ncbi:MAG TPA: hypothetical protein VMO26_20340 [Vicinamibacterales bacterium]|nr:hypothetical protein [Vicinamibacterales bacterium]
MSRHPRPTDVWISAIRAAVAIGGLAVPDITVRANDSVPPDRFIQQVVAQTTRSGLAIRAVRELRAGTASGKHQGWMTVETSASPSGAFSWNVLTEGGSNRTREKVFRAVLDTEAAAWRAGARDAAALTPENYTFTRLSSASARQVQIRLTPRRGDSKLIDGVLIVSPDGYPLQLEGTLARSPSFWVKSVRIVKRYGRIAGIALPTVIESHADLKLFGKSTFTMRYRYQEVNGRAVPATALTAELKP